MAQTKVKLIEDNAIKAVHIDETATGITLADLTVNDDVVINSTTGNALKIDSSQTFSGLFFDNTTSSFNPYIYAFGDDLEFGNLGGGMKMRIESNGNIGIGAINTTNSRLNVTSSSAIEDVIRWTDAVTDTGYLGIDSTGGIKVWAGGFLSFGAGGGGSFIERMRIDSSGNVGIGIAPTNNLHIHNANAATYINLTNGTVGSTAADGVSLIGNTNGDFLIRNRENANTLFYTNNTERMRITSGGNVLIGTQTENISARLFNVKASGKVAGSFYRVTTDSTDGVFEIISDFGSSNRVVLNIAADGDVTNINNSYGAISDAKLKENIVDASPKLDDLLQVKVRNFNYIGEDKKQLGVVAQELEEVFPSMIDESPDFEEQEVIDEEGNVTKERVDLGTTTKSVKYSVFVPMLIKAMQEQQEIINNLKSEIETLKSQINS